MKLFAILITLITVVCHTHAYAEKYVRKIEIVRKNVFDRELDKRYYMPFKVANSLHVVTREKVIRREILLERGDTFDKELLTESMRNLRSLEFIGEAVAETHEVGADSIDIKITTEDLWTTVAGLSTEGGGGFYSITAYAEEKNIAGLGVGIEVDATFNSDENDGFLVRAYDPRFLNSHNSVQLYYSDFEFVNQRILTINRPFYSLDTRYTYAININDDKLIPRLYNQGNEYYRYDKAYKHVDISFGRAFGRYHRIEPYVFYNYSDYDYGLYNSYPDIGVIPENETFSGPGAGFRIQTRRYITGKYLDQFGTIEDLTEHATLTTTILWSGSTFGGTSNLTSATVDFSFFCRPTSSLYVGYKNSYGSYYDGDLRRDRISNTMRGIVYFKPSRYQLLAIRMISTYAWRQKSVFQLTLGGDSGLRGYPDRYLSGSKRFLTNIEYKIFTPIRILTIGLGTAAFFDAGNVWRRDENIRFKELKTDIGVGLRLSLNKSSTARVIRLDLARALDEDNWYLSFGTENLFSLGFYQ